MIKSSCLQNIYDKCCVVGGLYSGIYALVLTFIN